jgi:adhesin HecA-like repeat protein
VAFGTPRTGTIAYSTNGGSVVGPAIVGPVAADDILLVIVGQKPSTANGGTVTPPSGWTLREELTAAGGYGATLGADTGNTNIRIYSKDVVNALISGGTDQFLFNLATNNVSWAFVVHIPTNGGTSYSVGVADGSRTTAPTAGTPFTVNLTNGSPATNFQSGDMAIWAMCIPTDVTTPGQFSAHSVTATGATFGTATEFNEPDSGTGNDIGGFSAYASVTSGSSTAAPSITVTATGTVTNVRGPIALIRLRETSQALTPSLFTNSNTFYTPTVAKGAVTLSPALFTNTNTFYSPDVTTSGGVQTLTQTARFDNTNTFYSPTIRRILSPALYSNTNTFYGPTVTKGAVTLSPARYDNTNTFYTATVTRGAITLAPTLYTNTNTFYSATVTTTKTLTPARYDNTNSFYTATVTSTYTLTPARYDNTNTFYSPTVTQSGATELLPDLYVNTNSFYSPTVTRGAVTLSPARYDNTNSFYSATVTRGAVTLAPARYNNTNTFYSATVIRAAVTLTPARYNNTNSFYSPTVTQGAVTLSPARLNNANAFYSPTVSRAADVLSPARLNNANTFYPATAQATYTLRFEDYYAPGYATPNYVGIAVENLQVWYTPAITTGPVTISPSRYDNTSIFYSARVARVLSPALYTNTNTIYSPSVGPILRPPLFENVNVFYPVQVIAAQILPAPPEQREQMPLETITRPGANWRPVGGPRQTMQIGTVGRQQMPITNYPRQPNPDA